jgi:hypothetical protein
MPLNPHKLVCPSCGQDFYVKWPSIKQICCSSECAQKRRLQQAMKKREKEWSNLCLNCGRRFLAKTSYWLRAQNQKFCSRECMGRYSLRKWAPVDQLVGKHYAKKGLLWCLEHVKYRASIEKWDFVPDLIQLKNRIAILRLKIEKGFKYTIQRSTTHWKKTGEWMFNENDKEVLLDILNRRTYKDLDLESE